MSSEKSRRSTYAKEDIERMARWGGFPAEYVEEVESERFENAESFRRAEDAVENCSLIFEHLRPELAYLFVNPNVVLALAERKGIADLPWAHIEEGDFDALEKLNNTLATKNIRILISKEPRVPEMGLYHITVVNQKALEWKTTTTRFEWIPKYDATSKDGYTTWLRSFYDAVNKAQDEGRLGEDIDEEIILQGILLGYPDQAILDFEEDYRLTSMARVEEVPLDYPEEFAKTSAVPNFDCYPENRHHQDIKKYVSEVDALFGRFYNSRWFQGVEKSKEYQNARTEYREVAETGRKLLRQTRSADQAN